MGSKLLFFQRLLLFFCLQFGTLVVETHLTKVKAVSSLSHILAGDIDHLSATDNEFYDYI